MRVLILTSRDISGNSGEATLMRGKEAALKNMGCSIAYVRFRWQQHKDLRGEDVVHSFSTWQWLLNPISCYHALRSIIVSWQPNVLVLSGHWLKFHPWVIARLKRIRPFAVSLDLQGALEEWTEYRLAFGKLSISYILERIIAVYERRLLRHTDLIEVVSNNFRGYIEKKYPTFGGSIVVVPCGIEAVIDDITFRKLRSVWRQRLGLGSRDTAAVYSGGVSRWQRVSDVVSFADKNRWLKVYLFINGSLGANFANLPPNIKVMSLSRDEVREALCAFDYGFLLRFDDLTNHVAFPNKASEYLNARLRIIVDSRNMGCVIPEFYSAFVGLDQVVPMDQSKMREAYAVDGLCYCRTVQPLFEAYRAVCKKRTYNM